MIKLDQALRAWQTPEFEATLKQGIVQSTDQLPLQQGLTTGNYVADDPISVAIINVTELENVIRARVGIFYRSVISGCSCADDPSPISKNNEYCEIQLDIDKATAATVVALVPE